MADPNAAGPAERFVQKKKTSRGGPLVMSVLTLGAVLLIGAFIVVSVASFEPEPEFIAKKTIYLPQRELEHRMAVSEFQQAASAPTTVQKLSAETLLSDVPPMPDLPETQFTPVESDNPIANATGMFGSSGLMGALSGLNSGSSSVSFLGVNDDAKKFLIVFDISQSVVTEMNKAGIQMEEIRDKTIELIEKLNANTMFGIIQHSRNYDLFQPYMVPATVENKQAAIAWLRSEFRTDGRSGSGWISGNPNGIQCVMKGAFQLQPDVIFLLSDASYQRSGEGAGSDVPWDELEADVDALQAQLQEPARIHFIGFGVEPEDASGMKDFIRHNKGKYREYE